MVARSIVLGSVLVSSLAGAAAGQFTLTSYDVQHTFIWNPPAGATHTPTVTGAGFQHVWVRDLGGLFEDWRAAPMPQAPGFDGFGRDMGAGMGAVNVARNGNVTPCIFYSFDIPPQGLLNSGGCLQLISPNTNTFANACVLFDVFPFGPGTPVQGTIRSSGSAGATGSGSEAYAFSSAGISIRDASPAGTIQWQPFMDSVSGSAYSQAIQQRDPIAITAVDDAGNTATAIVLEIGFASSSAGTMNWTGDIWSTDATDGLFTMSIDGPPIRNPGRLMIEIRNGVVTSARSNGSLAFPVPPVGTAVPLSVPIPNMLNIDYDAAGFGLPGVVSGVSLDFLGNGESPARSECAADFNGDGLLNPDDLADFITCFFLDIQFPEFCPAADFNGDGFRNPDDLADYITAFFTRCGGG